MDPFLLPAGRCPAISAETTVRTFTGAGGLHVTVLSSPHGSTRYLASDGTSNVAVLQVVSRDGTHARIANAFTSTGMRRRGIARMLLEAARTDFEEVLHSDDLSDFGRAFAKGTG